ncbi:hypothetical protein ACFRCG_15150 [Embleya sp. NPDC056575]|uniref:hypothetical protein n=1 Tax=unclassified Embleya TaxID=2699296 RepID=UPI0036BC0E8E
MKLPGFVKMGSTAITIALLPLAVGCTGNDARKDAEQGTREAGDRIGGRDRPGSHGEFVGTPAGREVFRRRG